MEKISSAEDYKKKINLSVSATIISLKNWKVI